MPEQANVFYRNKIDECFPRAGGWEKWRATANGYGVSFGRKENVLKSIMEMVAQLWMY